LDQDASLGNGLAVPVTVYGNVVKATHGETVRDETLGSGDASVPNQSFTLKKGPLSYVSAPSAGNESGVASPLEVRVEGVLWEEVRSLFLSQGEAQIYIVRHDDEGNASVAFGDGVRGSRLPAGVNNVTASYRHGAGSAAPPSDSITQMVKPVKV
ncbi:MAG: hypothetical protein IH801_04145, partial [Nitrospinae bacterium]|nr:hypothetical protein [Nitrospinota bacterium]